MDYLTRFFAPRMGIDEDPVTGSAHCCLAPYWASKLGRRVEACLEWAFPLVDLYSVHSD